MNRNLAIVISISFIVMITVLVMTYLLLGNDRDEVVEYRYEQIRMEYTYDGFNIRTQDLVSSLNRSSLMEVKDYNRTVIEVEIEDGNGPGNDSVHVRSSLHLRSVEKGHVTEFELVFVYPLEDPLIMNCSTPKDRDQAYSLIRSRYESDLERVENITGPVVEYLDSMLDTRGRRSNPGYLVVSEKKGRGIPNGNGPKGRNP